MHYSEHGGIIVAEHGADHASVEAALRDHDRQLSLEGLLSPSHGVIAWRVKRAVGGDRPSQVVCTWMNEEGVPLPLSHRLVDLVKTLDPNTRGHNDHYVDPDAANAALLAERARDAEADDEEWARDISRRWGRLPAFHRGIHLRRSSRRRDE